MAECSLSTGKSSALFSLTAVFTSFPPATRLSLLARAILLPAFAAARVGLRPAMPTMEFKTVGFSPKAAHSVTPSIPERTLVFVSANFILSSAAAFSSARAARRGLNFLACSSSFFASELAVRASTFKLSFSATSRACAPIEPVLPRIMSEFILTSEFIPKALQRRKARALRILRCRTCP